MIIPCRRKKFKMNSYTNYVRWMINNQTPRPEPRDARTEWDEISAAQDLVENKITPEEERIERAFRRDVIRYGAFPCPSCFEVFSVQLDADYHALYQCGRA